MFLRVVALRNLPNRAGNVKLSNRLFVCEKVRVTHRLVMSHEKSHQKY